jgi:hypothetical protein
MHLCHSVCTITIEHFLNQITSFLDENPHELVILSVNHVYVDNAAHHRVCLDKIIHTIGRERIASPATSPRTTLRQFRNKSIQVVLIYYDRVSAQQAHVWTPDHIRSPWPNTDNTNAVLSEAAINMLQPQRQCKQSDNVEMETLLAVQMLRTPRRRDIVRNRSLLRFARPLNTIVPRWLLHFCRDHSFNRCNIVLMDDCTFNHNELVKAMLTINDTRTNSDLTISVR